MGIGDGVEITVGEAVDVVYLIGIEMLYYCQEWRMVKGMSFVCLEIVV